MFLDTVVIVVVLVLAILGFCRGFIKELMGIAGMVAAFMLTTTYHDAFFEIYSGHVGSEMLAKVLSGITVFTGVIICAILVNNMVIKLLAPLRSSVLDKVAGSFIGLAKGLVISYVLFCVVETFVYVFAPYPRGEDEDVVEEIRLPLWFADTYVYNVFSMVSEYVGGVVPEPAYEKMTVVVRELLNKKHSGYGMDNEYEVTEPL